jgi:hypothetical protein
MRRAAATGRGAGRKTMATGRGRPTTAASGGLRGLMGGLLHRH